MSWWEVSTTVGPMQSGAATWTWASGAPAIFEGLLLDRRVIIEQPKDTDSLRVASDILEEHHCYEAAAILRKIADHKPVRHIFSGGISVMGGIFSGAVSVMGSK